MCRALIVLGLLVPSTGFSMVRVASDGRATVSGLEILVEADAWTLRARIDGNASQVAIILPVPGDRTDVAVVSAASMDALHYATAPRMKVFDTTNPCAGETAIGAPGQEPIMEVWPERPRAPGFTAVATVAPPRARHLDPLLGGLNLDGDSNRRLTRSARDGARIVILKMRAPGRMRGVWTPPLRVTTTGRSLPVGLIGPHTTPGKPVRVDLITKGDLHPGGPVVNLPSHVNMPEVTFEDPLDLYRAVAAHAVRREGAETVVRIHRASTVSRHFAIVGPNDHKRTIELSAGPQDPFGAEWWIRRVWRSPIDCDARARYLNNVRIQQKTEIQTYAALTGRPQSVIRGLQRERGYALVGDRLSPVKVRSPMKPTGPKERR